MASYKEMIIHQPKVYFSLIKEDIPGYINPTVGINSHSASNSFRFSQSKPKDSDPSLQPWFYNTGNPPKDSEIIRKEGKQMILLKDFQMV